MAATLAPDGRTVELTIADLRPADQQLLKLRLKAQDGTPIQQTVMHTVHVVPEDLAGAGRGGRAARARRGWR